MMRAPAWLLESSMTSPVAMPANCPRLPDVAERRERKRARVQLLHAKSE